jgi:hypothetical protein
MLPSKLQPITQCQVFEIEAEVMMTVFHRRGDLTVSNSRHATSTNFRSIINDKRANQ